MRVLFVTTARTTIVMPMVPLAWALRTAGHEVRMAAAEGFVDTITRAGLTAVPAGRNGDVWSRRSDAAEAEEAARKGLLAPWDAAEDEANAQWDQMLQGYITTVDHAHHTDNFPLIGPLVRFTRQWKPDLVIWEPFAFAGALAAEASGAAHARMLFGMDVFGVSRALFRGLRDDRPADDRPDPLADWLTGYAGRYGVAFTENLITGHFTVDQLPASLQLPSELEVVRTRYVPYGGPATVPSWLWNPPEQPRIGLTMGYAATEAFAGHTLDLREVLDALADLDVEVVATLADAERTTRKAPDNARVVTRVPLHALAPTCAAAIDHAGFGTLNTFASYGVPQLTVPYHFDEPLLAGRYAATGAGMCLPHEKATPQSIRDSLLRLLADPGFAGRAAVLQDEMAALPSPNETVATLEELTAKYRNGR